MDRFDSRLGTSEDNINNLKKLHRIQHIEVERLKERFQENWKSMSEETSHIQSMFPKKWRKSGKEAKLDQGLRIFQNWLHKVAHTFLEAWE